MKEEEVLKATRQLLWGPIRGDLGPEGPSDEREWP